MSNKKSIREAKKARYAAKKEREGERVIKWIFAVFIVLGLAYAVFYTIILN